MRAPVQFGRTKFDEVRDYLSGTKQRGQSQKKPLLSASHRLSKPDVSIVRKHCDANRDQREDAGNKSKAANLLDEAGPSMHSSSRAISAERCSPALLQCNQRCWADVRSRAFARLETSAVSAWARLPGELRSGRPSPNQSRSAVRRFGGQVAPVTHQFPQAVLTSDVRRRIVALFASPCLLTWAYSRLRRIQFACEVVPAAGPEADSPEAVRIARRTECRDLREP